ncbi:MAG: GFA family protein [Pseudomonadota bacterium]
MREIVADGGCLCGAVRYTVKGELLWSGYCHCESCRRQTSSPVACFFGVYEKDMMFHGESLAIYESSQGVERSFCKVCGSPISYVTRERPGEIELYTATLDFPERVAPTEHVHWHERLPWFCIKDNLPKHEGSATDDG